MSYSPVAIIIGIYRYLLYDVTVQGRCHDTWQLHGDVRQFLFIPQNDGNFPITNGGGYITNSDGDTTALVGYAVGNVVDDGI